MKNSGKVVLFSDGANDLNLDVNDMRLSSNDSHLLLFTGGMMSLTP